MDRRYVLLLLFPPCLRPLLEAWPCDRGLFWLRRREVFRGGRTRSGPCQVSSVAMPDAEGVRLLCSTYILAKYVVVRQSEDPGCCCCSPEGLVAYIDRRGCCTAVLRIRMSNSHRPHQSLHPHHETNHCCMSALPIQAPKKLPSNINPAAPLSGKTTPPHLSRDAAFGADENSPLLLDTEEEASAEASSTFPLVERRTRPAALPVPPVDVAVEARGRLREGGLEVTPLFDWSKYCRLPSLSSASCARVALGGVLLRGETPRR